MFNFNKEYGQKALFDTRTFEETKKKKVELSNFMKL